MRALVMLALALPATACDLDRLQFRNDHRVSITRPEDRSVVRLPLDVDWSYHDLVVGGEADRSTATGQQVAHFGVFVDNAPMPPGKTLRWLFRKDRACMAQEACPDEQYLTDHHIYLTTEGHLRLPQLPLPERRDEREEHTVTIVLVGPDGDRIGESAWHVEFYLERTEP